MDLPPPLDLLPTLAEGIGVTLQLLLGGAAVALAAGLAAGLGRSLRTVTWLGRPSAAARLGRSLWYGASTAYVETFRGTSALVQLFWFYFALPRLGVSMTALGAGILVLGLNTGSYGAEVVRGAVQAVPRGSGRRPGPWGSPRARSSGGWCCPRRRCGWCRRRGTS